MQSTPLHGTELKIDPCCRFSVRTLAGARDEIDTGTDEVPTPTCDLALSERQSTPLQGTELEIDVRNADCCASLRTLSPPNPRGAKDVQMVAEIDNEWFVDAAVQVPCSEERMEHARQDGGMREAAQRDEAMARNCRAFNPRWSSPPATDPPARSLLENNEPRGDTSHFHLEPRMLSMLPVSTYISVLNTKSLLGWGHMEDVSHYRNSLKKK